MRLFALCFALLISISLFSQSKKELAAEVTKLKAEIAELKKPKDVQLSDVHKKVSYGLGTLVAENLKTQGGDSLDLDALTVGITDVFMNKTPKIPQQEAMTIVQQYMQQAMEKKSSKMKEEGNAFLESNKKNE